MIVAVSLRPRCEACQRPTERCLCPLIPHLPHRCPVLVLQHTSESRHALNTARLAVLGLQQAQLWVGESFSQLNAYLAAFRHPVLLFPGPEAQTVEQWRAAQREPDLLIVPDGTWRKARKILYANPCLQELPRLQLNVAEASRYRVRKAPDAQSLASIEAIAQVLAELQPEQSYAALLRPFEQLIEEQIAAMGAEVYARNYGGLT